MKSKDQLIELSMDLVFTIISSWPEVVQGWLDDSCIKAAWLLMMAIKESLNRSYTQSAQLRKKIARGSQCNVKLSYGTLCFPWCTHCNGNSVYKFLFWELRGLSPNFHIHVSLIDLYIPRISLHISSSRTGRPILGIYNSLTDTWMWKLVLSPQYSFSGNICFKFLAFCLCSAYKR